MGRLEKHGAIWTLPPLVRMHAPVGFFVTVTALLLCSLGLVVHAVGDHLDCAQHVILNRGVEIWGECIPLAGISDGHALYPGDSI